MSSINRPGYYGESALRLALAAALTTTACREDDSATTTPVVDITSTSFDTDASGSTGGKDHMDMGGAESSTTDSTGDEPEPECGNGQVEAEEACDDQGESEACNVDCTLAECGDGVLNTSANEQCDDGNQINTDTCTNDCTEPAKGDGICSDGENKWAESACCTEKDAGWVPCGCVEGLCIQGSCNKETNKCECGNLEMYCSCQGENGFGTAQCETALGENTQCNGTMCVPDPCSANDPNCPDGHSCMNNQCVPTPLTKLSENPNALLNDIIAEMMKNWDKIVSSTRNAFKG